MKIEAGKALVGTKEDAIGMLTAAKEAGFNVLTRGLGLKDGKYTFLTASGSFMGVLPINSRKGQALLLTFVLGMAEGIGDNEGITKEFKDETRAVIPSEVWESVKPETAYNMEVVDGYVTTFELANSGSNTEPSKEDKVKALIAKGLLTAVTAPTMPDTVIDTMYATLG